MRRRSQPAAGRLGVITTGQAGGHAAAATAMLMALREPLCRPRMRNHASLNPYTALGWRCCHCPHSADGRTEAQPHREAQPGWAPRTAWLQSGSSGCLAPLQENRGGEGSGVWVGGGGLSHRLLASPVPGQDLGPAGPGPQKRLKQQAHGGVIEGEQMGRVGASRTDNEEWGLTIWGQHRGAGIVDPPRRPPLSPGYPIAQLQLPGEPGPCCCRSCPPPPQVSPTGLWQESLPGQKGGQHTPGWSCPQQRQEPHLIQPSCQPLKAGASLGSERGGN